ncbi:MAG: hypothetical protein HC830_12585 [Bacteroidetes bacterium]|nr:hypothetical protein [Bacteroidota bacterium]
MNGLSDLKPKKQFDLIPYLTGGYESFKKEEGNPFADGNRWIKNMGLDGKIGITNNMTLDFTINPDFGQVEADPAELNLTAYETYFVEKRPFFLEGNEIFDFTVNGNSLFYSRRIGSKPQFYPETEEDDFYTHKSNTTILGSGKLTGRTRNGLSVGVLETVTSSEYGTTYHQHRKSTARLRYI